MSQKTFIIPHSKKYHLKKNMHKNTSKKEFNIDKILSDFQGKYFIEQHEIYSEGECKRDKH